jgi:hypothetical protein
MAISGSKDLIVFPNDNSGRFSIKEVQYTGSGNFTVPTGVTAVEVIAVGGGGGGGGGAETVAGGGGGGGQVVRRNVNVTPGTTYGIGWYDLSTSNQLIFNKAAPAGDYSANDYEVYARRDAGSTQLILTIQFKDDAGPNPNIDEDIDGSLQSLIRQVRPSGSNVSVPTPTASGAGLL